MIKNNDIKVEKKRDEWMADNSAESQTMKIGSQCKLSSQFSPCLECLNSCFLSQMIAQLVF